MFMFVDRNSNIIKLLLFKFTLIMSSLAFSLFTTGRQNSLSDCWGPDSLWPCEGRQGGGLN